MFTEAEKNNNKKYKCFYIKFEIGEYMEFKEDDYIGKLSRAQLNAIKDIIGVPSGINTNSIYTVKCSYTGIRYLNREEVFGLFDFKQALRSKVFLTIQTNVGEPICSMSDIYNVFNTYDESDPYFLNNLYGNEFIYAINKLAKDHKDHIMIIYDEIDCIKYNAIDADVEDRVMLRKSIDFMSIVLDNAIHCSDKDAKIIYVFIPKHIYDSKEKFDKIKVTDKVKKYIKTEFKEMHVL